MFTFYYLKKASGLIHATGNQILVLVSENKNFLDEFEKFDAYIIFLLTSAFWFIRHASIDLSFCVFLITIYIVVLLLFIRLLAEVRPHYESHSGIPNCFVIHQHLTWLQSVMGRSHKVIR